MDFAHPSASWLLAWPPLLMLAAGRLRAQRSRAWIALGRTGRPPSDRWWPWIAAMFLLILAACGPRWGREGGSALPPGHDVILLVDVSRSMAAEDAVPNRLKAAVEAVGSLVDELARNDGERMGVVAFAGRAALKCPLTENPAPVKDALASLRPGELEPGGTDLGAGLIAAAEAFDDQEAAEGRSIVVVSDGEDHDQTWRKAMDLLRSRKIAVHAIAVGDADRGHVIPVTTRGGKVEPLTYRGETVLSRRDDRTLRALREVSGGAFVPMGVHRVDLGNLYRDRIEPSARRRRDFEQIPERVDRYASFAIAAVMVILATCWPFSRRVGLLVTLLAIGMGADPSGGSASRLVAEGDRLYASGRFAEGLARFEEAGKIDPRSPIPPYNAAAALFQMKRFAEAEARYRQAREPAAAPLRLRIDYALGNVAVAQGRYKQALEHYDACLSSPAKGVGAAGIRADAAANRAFAARLVPPPASPDPEGDRETPSQPKSGGSNNTPRKEANDANARPGAGTNPGPPNPSSNGTPPAPPSESPDQRLNAMLDDVKQAGASRLDGSPSTGKASTDRKDW